MTLTRIVHSLPSSLAKSMRWMRARVVDVHAVKSYSQEGEDRILDRIFENKEHGFYVDVGAHHPRRYSNTFLFYKMGWNGINIEPNPDSVELFIKERPRDVNLQIGIDSQEGSLAYYLFDEPALNTFDQQSAAITQADIHHKLLGVKAIPVYRLDSILRKYLPESRSIDFLSIDVEGFDLAVLESNNWNIFRPACVLVEAYSLHYEDAFKSEVFKFMKTNGYDLFAKTVNTLIFQNIGIPQETLTRRGRASPHPLRIQST